MKVLVACEFSQVVTGAFRDRGHEAYSCDILPAEGNPKWHIRDDVLNHLNDGWDLMIAHPPCTCLAVSGARWFKYRREEQERAVEFFMALVNAPIPRIAVENPVGIMSTRYRKPDQIIQPWMFGEDASKATCLWLKNLPPLMATMVIKKNRYANQTPSGRNNLPPGPDRAKIRSRTYPGIARAMAEQWG